ncbi:uncharacterized protein YbbC (DUF1343 family) [Lewinella aquimaris]|uniref:Uncharacterized protein YbbC (DUF1343 family) n=1 Tax=Neolewinella aquimaris TaxID=1835722 RepID=A0A840ED12_9BACT|nr:DUF1343 domain-containing protein [Neolewinella aquimaris]MBB4079868.1 uncharacterized protein YbbC (DUF1343 family) [Neolewinella aquimaris]
MASQTGQSQDLSSVPDSIAPAFPAAFYPDRYLPELEGKTLGLVVNQTSTVENTHLVDTLLALGQDVRRIFAPEHGFRGDADAGAQIKDGVDVRTGLPIRSLYGSNKKPTEQDLADIDLIVFDIQDVGARFYTYISTLHYVMESAARYGKPVLVLDRPNPNGHYVDGPIRQPGFESFVGLDPIPVVHGLTVGEYARMVNGEEWLGEGLQCELTVIPAPGYTHSTVYQLPVPPSPNLPNQRSIYLYPSLCFFEGTALSVGRGTDRQFQLYGHPALASAPDTFTPRPGPGAADPKLNGQLCRGFDLSNAEAGTYRGSQLDLSPVLSTYRILTDQGVTFFTRPDFFDLLAGTDSLRKMIEAGRSEAEIRESWEAGLAAYRAMRSGYLLYPE